MSEGHSRRGPVDQSAGAASDAVVGHVDCGSAQTDSDRTFLRSVIENQVVPRLLIAESAALRQPHEIASDVSRPSARDVNELLHIVVEADTAACVEYLQSRRSRGMQLETVYLGLLAPVAHRLGLMWERDELSFIDVTVGLARLQSLVHELTSDSCYGALNQDATRRIVLATARNEQHAFGLLIVAEFLRLAGWEVDGGPDVESGAPLIRMVGQEWYAVVGLSVGFEEHVDATRADIGKVRARSRNPKVGILTGGAAFSRDPSHAERMGADALARDGREAVAKAEALRSACA
jgi:MerR family transcriptional regulator, light-induced transcriptional regulator